MSAAAPAVEDHYARGALLEEILAALRASGLDRARLTAADLAPFDAFHLRGREATVELARRAALATGARVLDVGCGVGGSARFLATEFRCRVTGIDLTHEYIDVAAALTDRVGLSGAVTFRQASALALPFEPASFDAVWTEHVQMNVADKRGFYAEIAKVLVPGGHFLFHDIFRGAASPLYFPVPWAGDPAISFLAAPDEVRALLEALGFLIIAWDDTTARSLAWLEAMQAKRASAGPPVLGTHLLMGANAGVKLANLERNLREDRVAVVQATLRRA